MPSREDIARLSSKLHEDESSQNDEQLREGIERLRHKNDEIVAVHDAAVRTPLESQLTAEREKVQQLRGAIEDYIHNDIGRKDTLHNLEQALSDTEGK